MLSTMNRPTILPIALLSTLAFFALTSTSMAQQPAKPSEEPASPPTLGPPATLPPDAPLPPKKVPSDDMVPTVSIRTDDEGQLVEEYRINGAVYMMRVTPKKGPAYYLLDTDGDGNLETSQIPGDPGPQPVYWKLFEWR